MASELRNIVLSLALAASQGIAAPAVAPPPGPAPVAASPAQMSLAALKLLEPGLWELDIKGRAPKLSCVVNTAVLVQIEHDQPGCSRFVIANDAKSSTVHYSCQRTGWGRTTVRVETPAAAVIQTQGISRNQPFDYIVQAHRVGACAAQTVSKQR
jgi:hypothetical protein